jgi:hypothetical protein
MLDLLAIYFKLFFSSLTVYEGGSKEVLKKFHRQQAKSLPCRQTCDPDSQSGRSAAALIFESLQVGTPVGV